MKALMCRTQISAVALPGYLTGSLTLAILRMQMQWRPAKHYSPAEVEADQMPVLSNPDNSSPSQVSDSGADPNTSTNRPWRRHSFQ